MDYFCPGTATNIRFRREGRPAPKGSKEFKRMTIELSHQVAKPPPPPAPGRSKSSDRPVVLRLHGRPRSVPGEEAYLRSELEQAAIDIAAGR
jgi:hypothetical protein